KTGSSLVYSTYFGGNINNQGNGIAVDSEGNAYVIGSTNSPNLPVVNAFQSTNKGGDAFVIKLNASGNALIYCTYLGGTSNEFGNSIALDSEGNAYLTGQTLSTDFPTSIPMQATS